MRLNDNTSRKIQIKELLIMRKIVFIKAFVGHVMITRSHENWERDKRPLYILKCHNQNIDT